MAAAKRALEADDDPELLKKFKANDNVNTIEKFLDWCRTGKLVLSDKVSKILLPDMCQQCLSIILSLFKIV